MSWQFEHISKIRRNKYWLDDSSRGSEKNPLLKDLQQSIDKLSRDLYRKDSRFLLELIQNAEDNNYDCDEPSLTFTLLKKDPTNSELSEGALIVSNNEIGFSIENMDAMCSIGSSFKEKIKGYIGEKGIGFKSVFKITKSTYIFSNGYQVRFKDEIPELGLGYIVPEWIDEVPKIAKPGFTTIILPLNKTGISFSTVCNMIKEFTPETILFLSKIRNLGFSVEGDFNMVISKSVEKEHVTCLNVKTDVDGKTSTTQKKHLLHTKNFLRPKDLLVDGRENVLDSDITISFPIGDKSSEGAIYAYLPVLEDSGLPFILNADFLVAGSRDIIHEDNEWNRWLLEEIPDLFIEAFTRFIKIPEYRYEVYRHIPLESDLKISYFKPIIDPIIEKLSTLPIIPTLPNGEFVVPSEAKLSHEFWRVISELSLPSYLQDRLTTKELQETILSDVAKAIGLLRLDSEDEISCLNEEPWIRSIGYNGLIKLYKYLSKQTTRFSVEELRKCRIIPIEENQGIGYSCDDVQPIYLQATEEDIKALEKKPNIIDVPIRFLDKDFYSLIKDDERLIAWMKAMLVVYPFSLESYAYDSTQWFRKHYQDLDDKQFVVVSNYILEHSSSDTEWTDFPILLSDGQRLLFPNEMPLDTELVVPAGQNPDSGWQLIFLSQEDRNHFFVLSDLYLEDDEQKPKIVSLTKATSSPPLFKETSYPRKENMFDWRSSDKFSDIEKEMLEKACRKSTSYMLDEINISKTFKPSGLNSDLTEKTAVALINWLNGRFKDCNHQSLAVELQSEVGWFYRQSQTDEFESEMSLFLQNEAWLPSTKGMQKPSLVFKKNADIWDFFEDTVLYLKHDIGDNLIKYLGIKDQLSIDDLINYLISLSDSNEGNIQAAEKIYTYLQDRYLISYIHQLTSSNCIAIPQDDKIIWVSPKACIWKDRSDLFRNEFYYLSPIYPKLKDFFIDVLKVAPDISDEQFCILWLDIQDREVADIKETEEKVMLLYNKLMPSFRSHINFYEERWRKFRNQAKLWSSGKKFLDPSELYIPDDGILKEVFAKEQVHFLWYPNRSSYTQWERLHKFFQIQSLKKSVEISLKNFEKERYIDSPVFLTDSAKKLILVWLWEKERDHYNWLKENGYIENILKASEYNVKELVIEFTLEDVTVRHEWDCFFDIFREKLYYSENPARTMIAADISRALGGDEVDEDLESWVKGVLEAKESDLTIELKKNNWQIPGELRQLIPGYDVEPEETDIYEPQKEEQDDTVTETEEDCDDSSVDEPSGQDESIDDKSESDTDVELQKPYQDKQDKSDSRSQGFSVVSPKKDLKDMDESDETQVFDDPDTEVPPIISLRDELFNNFNTKDRPKKDDFVGEYTFESNNPDRRYNKEYEIIREKSENARTPEDRRREVKRKMLDGADPLVREALLRWYSGECQICGYTFYQKNGNPFFVSHYLVSRSVSDNMDAKGNSVCLCANHFVQMYFGRIKSPDILLQLESINPEDESFKLHLEIDGENMTISYNQQHAIALKAFFESFDIPPA